MVNDRFGFLTSKCKNCKYWSYYCNMIFQIYDCPAFRNECMIGGRLMNKMEEIQQFQELAREAISIYDRRIAFYTGILDKLQTIINQFDGVKNNV